MRPTHSALWTTVRGHRAEVEDVRENSDLSEVPAQRSSPARACPQWTRPAGALGTASRKAGGLKPWLS